MMFLLNMAYNMNGFTRDTILPFFCFGFTILLIAGCSTSRTRYSGITSVRKYQKNIPFVYKNNINLVAPDLDKSDKVSVNAKLNTQLDDSARVKIKDVAFILHYINRPPVFDTE